MWARKVEIRAPKLSFERIGVLKYTWEGAVALGWRSVFPINWGFQHDKATSYTSKVAKMLFSWQGIRFMKWSARSLDLTPIDNLWVQLLRALYAENRQFTDSLGPEHLCNRKLEFYQWWNNSMQYEHQPTVYLIPRQFTSYCTVLHDSSVLKKTWPQYITVPYSTVQ